MFDFVELVSTTALQIFAALSRRVDLQVALTNKIAQTFDLRWRSS
ncbi:hypothetical protein QCM77_40315 [Bradyrhizobium sp. SSUT18]|nr:hypothetical protein [Bradyrhizobium sp. SSUT18]MDH2406080.1 hypothetical protein [Bradyrhizobium sp. SSUT18]